MARKNEVTGWVGWIYFAAFFLVLEGIFQIIAGIVILFNKTVILATDQSVWIADLATWGWGYILIGILVLLTGIALFSGATWARVMAVIFAGISAIANFMFIPVYPFWSIIVLVIDCLVIYAVLAHGEEARIAAEDYRETR